MDEPSPKRPRRKPGENRERLVSAGIQEFARLGYRGASTADIAALAGVPQPHVYASFRAKRELFLACAERTIDTMIASGQTGERGRQRSVGLRPPAGIHAQFVLQAFAALGDPDLSEELSILLARLRAELGRPELERVLARAVSGLL